MHDILLFMKTIYVCCPANSYTGGPTLAHQLCFTLNNLGLNSKMWYYCNPLKRPFIKPVHPNYVKFNNPYVIYFPQDTTNTIIVALDTFTDILQKFVRAEKYIWWMSVDNYYLCMSNFADRLLKRLFGFNPTIEYHKKYKNCKRYLAFKDANVKNLVQSEYAKEFLLSEGINSNFIYRLSDYLEDEILNDMDKEVAQRENNIILYNPQKGYEFTQKIISQSPQYDWTPLINLTKSQVSLLLRKSKLYIDFGNHPGKDRFPREAVASGCCIITGKRGSARNEIDIPIKDCYKFNDIQSEMPEILKKIDYIMSNYNSCIYDFISYKERIKNEKEIFISDIESIFKK